MGLFLVWCKFGVGIYMIVDYFRVSTATFGAVRNELSGSIDCSAFFTFVLHSHISPPLFHYQDRFCTMVHNVVGYATQEPSSQSTETSATDDD